MQRITDRDEATRLVVCFGSELHFPSLSALHGKRSQQFQSREILLVECALSTREKLALESLDNQGVVIPNIADGPTREFLSLLGELGASFVTPKLLNWACNFGIFLYLIMEPNDFCVS